MRARLSYRSSDGSASAAIIALAIVAWVFGSLITHIWVCVATNWAAMLILGLVCFPVGVVHGTGIWFGLW